jgi:hypothetical protein
MAEDSGQKVGSYWLGRKLEGEGIAETRMGRHVLGGEAVVKLLKMSFTSQQEMEQFHKEARTLAALDHPHILRVREVGFQHNKPYLIRDYAPNGSLRQPSGTRLPLDRVVDYVTQAAEGLQFAHDRQVIHRAIKPENLLLGRNNEVLVADFGLATVAQNTSRTPQGFVGTAAYVAPEQLMSKLAPASDQYALAVVVYEWLTGELPFQGDPMAVMFQHAQAPVPSLRAKVPNLPPAVEQVVLKALAKDPQQRFASVRAFAAELRRAYQSAMAPPGAGAAPAVQPALAALPPTIIAANPPGGAAALPAGAPPRGTTLVIHESLGKFAEDWRLVLAWSPDGQRIASACGTQALRQDGWDSVWAIAEVWDALTGQNLNRYYNRSYQFHIHDILWSPNVQYTVVLGAHQAVMWKWEARREVKRKVKGKFWPREREVVESVEPVVGTLGDSSPPNFSFFPLMVLWSPDLSKVAALSSDGLEVSSLRDREPIVQTAVSARSCNGGAVAWSPDGTRIAWGAGNEVPVWDVRSYEQEGHHLLTYRDTAARLLQ